MYRLIRHIFRKTTGFTTFVVKHMPHPRYWPEWLQRLRLDHHFYNTIGRHIDFEHPVTFNEKIQLYELYYKNPDLPRLCDKIEFKNYIREKLGEGYTPKTLGAWDDADKIDFSALTPPYVLKSNCSCSGRNMMVIKDGDFDPAELREKIRPWLDYRNTTQRDVAWGYWYIKPMIFAEELIGNGEAPVIDYKFYCFDGKPYCAYSCYEDEETKRIGSKMAFYDAKWNLIDARYVYGKRIPDIFPVPAPKYLDEMTELAKKLSAGFPFMRVDMYDTENGVLVGELTYNSACGNRPFYPESFDYELGALFHYPEN